MQAFLASTAIVACLMSCAVAQAEETGVASHYSDLSMTASGGSYRSGAKVCAHRTLPFGTELTVENLRNGKRVVVTVVDRGPFVKGRLIDLSESAADVLGFTGLQRVRITVRKDNDRAEKTAAKSER